MEIRSWGLPLLLTAGGCRRCLLLGLPGGGMKSRQMLEEEEEEEEEGGGMKSRQMVRRSQRRGQGRDASGFTRLERNRCTPTTTTTTTRSSTSIPTPPDLVPTAPHATPPTDSQPASQGHGLPQSISSDNHRERVMHTDRGGGGGGGGRRRRRKRRRQMQGGRGWRTNHTTITITITIIILIIIIIIILILSPESVIQGPGPLTCDIITSATMRVGALLVHDNNMYACNRASCETPAFSGGRLNMGTEPLLSGTGSPTPSLGLAATAATAKPCAISSKVRPLVSGTRRPLVLPSPAPPRLYGAPAFSGGRLNMGTEPLLSGTGSPTPSLGLAATAATAKPCAISSKVKMKKKMSSTMKMMKT
ncbi:hypothetical protein CRUP_006692 [Coryphaenoides rupestris]|nr:hypothetical protein CRUP_006692 [Coryphaenoides rupestris]